MLKIRGSGVMVLDDIGREVFAGDAAKGELTVSGRIEGQPITYRRNYLFANDGITVRLELTPMRTPGQAK